MPGKWRLPPYTVENTLMSTGELVDWGVKLLGVPDVWKLAAGEGVKVAVLDTGITGNHPDLKDQIEQVRDFTGSPYGAGDQNGHGTHCAGIVAAREGNDYGCVGVAPKARLMIGKVLGDNGSGSSQGVANGILWAVEQKADVISMSLGSPSPDNTIRRALKRAVDEGVFVICAAGNSGPGPNTVDYPGKWPEAIAVGAMNAQKQISRFSSRGPEVCVVAPGEQVTSCYHRTPLATLSGTSMATPFVAGVVALMISHNRKNGGPAIDGQGGLRNLLQQNTTDLDKVGNDPNAGWGLVEPGKLIREGTQPKPPPVPGDQGRWLLDLILAIIARLLAGKTQREQQAIVADVAKALEKHGGDVCQESVEELMGRVRRPRRKR